MEMMLLAPQCTVEMLVHAFVDVAVGSLASSSLDGPTLCQRGKITWRLLDNVDGGSLPLTMVLLAHWLLSTLHCAACIGYIL
jgi:hypothetical protein